MSYLFFQRHTSAIALIIVAACSSVATVDPSSTSTAASGGSGGSGGDSRTCDEPEDCADGEGCVEGKCGTCSMGSECAAGVCSSGQCMAGNCGDDVKNQTESDVDCGGPCGKCPEGKSCDDSTDCASSICADGKCAAVPSCADGVKNQTESDVDCGGRCGKCPEGKSCGGNRDCQSSVCTNEVCSTLQSSLGAAIMLDGPSAYWPLDEASGTTAFDKSGNNRNGTYGGVVKLGGSGLAGPAADFAGTGWVDTPYATSTLLASASVGTITALVKMPATFVSASSFASHYVPHVFSNNAWFLGASVATYNGVSGVHFWNFYTGNLHDVVSVTVPKDKWVHVAWVLGSGKLTGYVNGAPLSVPVAGPCASMGVLGIGRMFQNGNTIAPNTIYPGQVQHVATFTKELGANRIEAHAGAVGLFP